ncbi:LamG domain-containing protein [Candidatus Poribacteria bacterium]|nr:LamG domain-containing protein [Candidatus Poribacteria bacterium]MYK18136.1 LamG domain-containing protein [Candidatus Poribacteria bacterium]
MRLVMYVLAAALIVGSALSTYAAVEDDGLILYFSFDEAKGGTLVDETGGGNDAEIVDGAKIVKNEGVYGGSMLFAKGADSVTVDSFKELEDYTDNSFLFWLNFTDPNSGGWDQIIAKKAPGSDRSPGIWTCNRVPLHIHYRFNPGNAGSHCVGPDGEGDTFDENKWYHIAGIKEGTDFLFYIDGKVVDEQTVPKDHVQGAEKLYIGRTNYNAAKFYIDDLYVYDRALDADEVTSVMDGKLLPVEPEDKLSTTWGQLKARRD